MPFCLDSTFLDLSASDKEEKVLSLMGFRDINNMVPIMLLLELKLSVVF